MAALPNIPICILAGGGSRRFGEDKALAKLGGKPLLSHVLGRVRGQTSGPIAINTAPAQEYERWGLPIITDTARDGVGPLAGITTATEWAGAQGSDRVVTIAVDLPFAPFDFVKKLSAAGAPAIAITAGRWHPVNGLWRADQLLALQTYLESGKRSAHGWAESCNAALVTFDHAAGGIDPFWNINTPEDMSKAEEMLRG